MHAKNSILWKRKKENENMRARDKHHDIKDKYTNYIIFNLYTVKLIHNNK
jgi:hypothetical protein